MSIIQELRRNWHKFTFAVDKNKPQLYFYAGLLGIGATIFAVGKATWHAKDVANNADEDVKSVEDRQNDETTELTEEAAKAEIKKIRVHEGVELAKTYAFPAALGVASVGCLFASNNTWKGRYAGATAALATVTEGYKALRSKVVDKFGEDILKELVSPSEGTKEEKVVDEETGEITTTSKRVVDPNKLSPYARLFTSSNPYWHGDLSFDINFIKAQQRFANDKCRAYGHYILNDAYRDLGFKENKAGMIVGWIFDKHNSEGDNFIEYICEQVLVVNENGEFEDAIMIDFNVDGNIYDRLE